MKSTLLNTLSAAILLLVASGAHAESVASRLCYVQKKGADNVYAQGLGQLEIPADDFEPHIIYKDSKYFYQVTVTEGTGVVTLAMFNPRNPNSLVIVSAESDKSITFINESAKRLIGCTELRK